MPQLLCKIEDKIAKPLNDLMVCNNSDFTIKFYFDEQWSSFRFKTARFIWGKGVYQDVVFEGDECKVPIVSDTRYMAVGVFAGEDIKTSTPAIFNCRRTILDGIGVPAAPSEDVYNQIIELLKQSGGLYELPTATATRLGGIKVGDGLVIEEDGTLSSISGSEHIVGRVDATEGSAYHGEIFNSYQDDPLYLTPNRATGQYSHAEGVGTAATEMASHAEGSSTEANGNFSHAEGYYTMAKGIASHAEGQGNRAMGTYSHVEGYQTTASGSASHAEGELTTADAPQSHAEGKGSSATGEASHAEGINTRAYGRASHAEGFHTQASSNSQHVQGKYNIADPSKVMIIGWGSDDQHRDNIFTVDTNGNIVCGKTNESGIFEYATINGMQIADIGQLRAKPSTILPSGFVALDQNMMTLTRAEYDAIRIKDPNTYYFVIDDEVYMAIINDNVIDLQSTWSSQKIKDYIDAQIAAALGK